MHALIEAQRKGLRFFARRLRERYAFGTMWRLLCAGLLLATSCAGTTAAKGDSTANADRDAATRAERRRERQKVRDLEHQVAKLKAEMGTKRSPSNAMSPVLPVEVREPASSPDAERRRPERPMPAYRAVEGEDRDAVVAGYDEEGVEILYVGEAASAESVRPTVQLSGTGTRLKKVVRSRTSARSRSSARPPLPALPPPPSDRLEVTSGAGPVVAKLSPASKPLAPVKASAASKSAAPSKAKKPAPKGARSAYRAAYETLKGGDHARAISGFRKFLRQHPKHDYADNAQYWLGEAFYDQRQYDAALAEFQTVILNYPRGNKVTGAKLKAAYCHVALGNYARAKTLLEQLVTEHPNSGPARLAADKLKSL